MRLVPRMTAYFIVLVCCVAAFLCLQNGIFAQKKSPKPAPKLDPNADFKKELPRIPPKSPAESLKSFQLLPGFRIETAAAEPLVTDPTSISFDARGRMYVVCMRGYSEEPGDLLGEIRRLEDVDGDGRFDKSSVLVDKLSWPTGVICYDGGVYVAMPPDIWYFKDTDGDGKADVRRKVFTGFGRSNVQGLLNSLRWGLDNKIHGATSSSGGSVRAVNSKNKPAKSTKQQPPLQLRGRDFAFDPRTEKIEATSGGAQHGLSFDDWGRKFVCSNSSHIQMVMFEDRYLRRNKYLPAPSARKLIAVDGGQAEVFRISPVEPWRIVRTRLRVAKQVPGPVEGGGRAAGYFTGSTGVTIYRGNAWPKKYLGNAFIGDVGSNIVHRKLLQPDSIGFRAIRADQKREFLASKEIWFRPVQMANAPDGTLYVLDMYREVIEHPKSLPPVIKKHLDLTSGRDRGRIYRIVPDGFKQPKLPRLDQMTAEQLVATLEHANGWHRDAAARLLYERRDRSAVRPLAKLAVESKAPLARVHALHALYGLDGARGVLPHVVLELLHDPHPRVREHAVLLGEQVAENQDSIRQALFKMAMSDEPDLRVRYQLAFSLGQLPPSPSRNKALAAIAKRDGGDAWVRLALFSSLSEGAGEVFAELAKDQATRKSPAGRQMIATLALQIGLSNRNDALADVLKAVAALPPGEKRLASAVVRGLSEGLNKSGSPLRKALASAGGSVGKILDDLLKDARKRAADVKQSETARAEAVRTLGLSTFAGERDLLASLLNNRQPRGVQLAALAALSRYSDAGVAAVVIRGWPGFSPGVRTQATEVLFARGERIVALLDAIERKQFPPGDLTPARIQFLRAHGDAQIRRRAAKLLSEVKLQRRQDVVKAYQGALKLKGDVVRGKMAFKKVCSKCHKLEGVGQEMAPSLAAMKNRGAAAILLNVMDPNREVNPQFVNYIVQTEDGRTLTGIIAAETATSVTLRRAENQTDTILRVNIAILQSTGLSIMPEGMEKELNHQAMADLIAYLLSVK